MANITSASETDSQSRSPETHNVMILPNSISYARDEKTFYFRNATIRYEWMPSTYLSWSNPHNDEVDLKLSPDGTLTVIGESTLLSKGPDGRLITDVHFKPKEPITPTSERTAFKGKIQYFLQKTVQEDETGKWEQVERTTEVNGLVIPWIQWIAKTE